MFPNRKIPGNQNLQIYQEWLPNRKINKSNQTTFPIRKFLGNQNP